MLVAKVRRQPTKKLVFLGSTIGKSKSQSVTKRQRPAANGRSTVDVAPLAGRLLYGVSKKEPSDVIVHRKRELRCDVIMTLRAMGAM